MEEFQKKRRYGTICFCIGFLLGGFIGSILTFIAIYLLRQASKLVSTDEELKSINIRFFWAWFVFGFVSVSTVTLSSLDANEIIPFKTFEGLLFGGIAYLFRKKTSKISNPRYDTLEEKLNAVVVGLGYEDFEELKNTVCNEYNIAIRNNMKLENQANKIAQALDFEDFDGLFEYVIDNY